jgi:hypothetical protein
MSNPSGTEALVPKGTYEGLKKAKELLTPVQWTAYRDVFNDDRFTILDVSERDTSDIGRVVYFQHLYADKESGTSISFETAIEDRYGFYNNKFRYPSITIYIDYSNEIGTSAIEDLVELHENLASELNYPISYIHFYPKQSEQNNDKNRHPAYYFANELGYHVFQSTPTPNPNWITCIKRYEDRIKQFPVIAERQVIHRLRPSPQSPELSGEFGFLPENWQRALTLTGAYPDAAPRQSGRRRGHNGW